MINGTTGVSALGAIDAATFSSANAVAFAGRIQAVSKTDNTVNSTYTVQIILKKAVNGKYLNGIDFTVQPVENTVDGEGDKTVYRSKTDTNTFHANVDQATNTSMTVGEVNLEIAPSLTAKNDLGINYRNIVTGFQADEGAVVYAVTQRTSSTLVLKRLDATTNDDSDKLTGTLLQDYNSGYFADSGYMVGPTHNSWGCAEIVVLPEQYARQMELGELEAVTARV